MEIVFFCTQRKIPELFPRYLTVPSKGKVNQSVALYSKGMFLYVWLNYSRLLGQITMPAVVYHKYFGADASFQHEQVNLGSFCKI